MRAFNRSFKTPVLDWDSTVGNQAPLGLQPAAQNFVAIVACEYVYSGKMLVLEDELSKLEWIIKNNYFDISWLVDLSARERT